MAKKLIFVGATDQTIDVFIQDSSSTTGAGLTGLVYTSPSLVCYYRKGATGSATALTLATQTVGGAHSDGGFVEISSGNMPGFYRLDLSDTIVDALGSATLTLKGAANMAPSTVELQMVAFDPEAALATPTNITAGTITTATNVTTISTDGITGTSLSAGALTDIQATVWNATLASYLTAGSAGAALNAAGSAGDPWATALPGAYAAGTAGFLLGTNLDERISLVPGLGWDVTLAAHLTAGSTGFALNAAGGGGSGITVQEIWAAALPGSFAPGEAGYILGTSNNQVCCGGPRTRRGTSPTVTFNRTYVKRVGEIIEEALRDAKIIPAEQPVSDNDYQNGLDALNNVSKFWQTQGLHLWLQERAVLPLNPGQKMYTLGPDGDPCGYESTFFDTATNAAAVTGDETIMVASTEGMEGAPNILQSSPVVSTQGWTIFDTGVVTVNAGVRVTNGAAASGGATYDLEAEIGQTYRLRINFVLGTSVSAVLSVLNASLVADTITATATGLVELTITAQVETITFKIENTSTTITEYSTVAGLNYVNVLTGSYIGIELDSGVMQWTNVINVVSDTEIDITLPLVSDSASGNQVFSYIEQIDKPLRLFNVTYVNQPGNSEIPVDNWSRQEYMQQPVKNSQGTVNQWYYNPYIDHGQLYVWQTAVNVSNLLYIDVRRPLAVYESIEEYLDYPTEYFLPLKWSLAAELGPQYGVKAERQMVLEQKAATFLQSSLDSDNELSSLYTGPSYND
ncbi:MAG: hypothetical protein V4563_17640 [Pseudomonadota bacterium]